METGGILIGAYIESGCVLVLGATGPGPNAEHYGAEYALDFQHAQKELERYVARYPSVDYLGEWHRHPGAMSRPSSGDWRSAARILQDPSYRVDSLINPITILSGGRASIYFYYLHRFDIAVRRDFTSLTYDQVSGQDRRVREFLDLEERRRLRRAPAPPWHLNSGGRRRLVEELEELDSEFRVETAEARGSDYQFEVEPRATEESRVRVSLICPSTYPVTAPHVRVERDGQVVAHESSVLPRWSARNRLVEIAREALRDVLPSGHPTSSAVAHATATPRRTAVVSVAAILATALGITVSALALANVIPPKSWCSQALEQARGEVVTQTARASATPSGLEVRALTEDDVLQCRADPRMPTTGLAQANVFVFSPRDTTVRLRIGPVLPSVDTMLDLTEPSARFTFTQLDFGLPTTYEVLIEGCPAGTCTEQVPIPAQGGLGIRVLGG